MCILCVFSLVVVVYNDLMMDDLRSNSIRYSYISKTTKTT